MFITSSESGNHEIQHRSMAPPLLKTQDPLAIKFLFKGLMQRIAEPLGLCQRSHIQIVHGPTSIRPRSEERRKASTLQYASSLYDLFEEAKHIGVDLQNSSLGLSLIRSVLKRALPEQWELREMGLPLNSPGKVIAPGSREYFEQLASPHRERPVLWNAHDYCDHYEYEISTCAYITGAILTRCQAAKTLDEDRWSVLQLALVNYEHPRWIIMHRALWRIWTFCRIFGSGKERENDWQGQNAWLGGTTGFGESEPISRPGSLQSEVLDIPPESFAYGNYNGLTSDELGDMIYLWRCLEILLRDHLRSGPLPDFVLRNPELIDPALIEKTEAGWQITDSCIDSMLSLGLAATSYLLSSYREHPLQMAHNLSWTSHPVLQRRKGDLSFFIDACERKMASLNHKH
ncbi:hypothetical protein N7523_005585 [Penicillium sp. IBT 18751x]|nr:hypothetical protein N7523_005585 [Penicillium sp. IBT 18751x]